MGERKVLNKYFPPDFDPSKLPRGKRVRSEDKQMKVRMMLPMSVRCNTCGTFMYKGTKFNTRMEDVRGEDYLGIKIFRFYYHCTNCAAEFCMKTDPKTADYIVEGGASRNYEPWRDKDAAVAASAAAREDEEKGNAMKALENRTLDSKREMDIMTALDEMRSLQARHEAVGTDAALAALQRSAAAEGGADLDEDDEEAVRRMLLERAGFVRRLSDSDEGEDTAGASEAGTKGRRAGPSVAATAWAEERGGEAAERGGQAEPAQQGQQEGQREADGIRAAPAGGTGNGATISMAPPPPPAPLPSFGARGAAVVVKRKPAPAACAAPGKPPSLEGGGLPGLLVAYGSDSD